MWIKCEFVYVVLKVFTACRNVAFRRMSLVRLLFSTISLFELFYLDHKYPI